MTDSSAILETARTMLTILVDGPQWKRGNPENTAILVLPGIYQEYRIQGGVDIWKQNQSQRLWVAGTRGDPAYPREHIVEVAGVDSPNIVCGEFCHHTPDQMRWCLKMLKDNPEISHLIMTTAAYHLPRCVLTNVAAMEKASVRIPISPIPLTNPNGDSFPPTGKEGWEDWPSEVSKIIMHQTTGDVASLSQWRDYLKWRLNI